MSDILVSRKRHRRAIDPCLGFYVTSTRACNEDLQENDSNFPAAFGSVLSSTLVERRAAVKHEQQSSYLAAGIYPRISALGQTAGTNVMTSFRRTTASETPSIAPVVSQCDPHHDIPLANPKASSITVDKFLRLSAAANKKARYHDVLKRKRLYRALEKTVPETEKTAQSKNICANMSTLSVENGSLLQKVDLDLDEDSLQLRSRKIRRTISTSTTDQESDIEDMDYDAASETSSNKEDATCSSLYQKEMARRRRRKPNPKKLKERLFEALVFTDGHPDDSLITLDDPNNPHRPPLHFVPQESAVIDGDKRMTSAFVNPRRSLAIRSATLSISTRHNGSEARLGSMLKLWPENALQQVKAAQESQKNQSDKHKTKRARIPNNRSTNSAFEFQSHDRQPLTFTDAVCAERSYSRMFSSAVVGPSKPKPEKGLSPRGVIDLPPIENGGIVLKRLSNKGRDSNAEGDNIAESIDEPSTFRTPGSCVDLPNRQSNAPQPSQLEGDNQHQSSLLYSAVFCLLSEETSPGTGPHYNESPQILTAENTLQRGANNDNLSTNLYGGETAPEAINTSLNKMSDFLATSTEYRQKPVQRGSVAHHRDVGSHCQPHCNRPSITRPRLLRTYEDHGRPAGLAIELSPISEFSKASIEGYEGTILDEIENEYPRMRSTFGF